MYLKLKPSPTSSTLQPTTIGFTSKTAKRSGETLPLRPEKIQHRAMGSLSRCPSTTNQLHKPGAPTANRQIPPRIPKAAKHRLGTRKYRRIHHHNEATLRDKGPNDQLSRILLRRLLWQCLVLPHMPAHGALLPALRATTPPPVRSAYKHRSEQRANFAFYAAIGPRRNQESRIPAP